MAIKISNLERISAQLAQKNYVYKDLFLDFSKMGNFDPALGREVRGNDIKVSYDESAIKNSLKNLFNTRPGQRFLFPLYGLDLNQFLFEAVTEDNGRIIGETIATSIKNFEPRVKIETIRVIAMPDDNQYDITVAVLVPIFNTIAAINTILDTKTQSFIFLETSRNK